MSIKADIQSLEQTALIELYVLDATNLPGGGLTYFHAGTNKLQQPVVWQGNTYEPMPIEASGFDVTTQGAAPRPKVRIANVNGLLSASVKAFDDFVGCKISRKRTYAKYLDIINFPPSETVAKQRYSETGYAANKSINSGGAFNLTYYMANGGPDLLGAFGSNSALYAAHWRDAGVYEGRPGNSAGAFNTAFYVATYPNDCRYNPTADQTQYIPDDIWYVERKIAETRHLIEFELSSAFDLVGVQLPNRQIIQNSCPWKYRGTECGYTGAMYTSSNTSTTNSSLDICAKTLTACRTRFGTSPIRFGGFPG